jgi:hypothetical protein
MFESRILLYSRGVTPCSQLDTVTCRPISKERVGKTRVGCRMYVETTTY